MKLFRLLMITWFIPGLVIAMQEKHLDFQIKNQFNEINDCQNYANALNQALLKNRKIIEQQEKEIIELEQKYNKRVEEIQIGYDFLSAKNITASLNSLVILLQNEWSKNQDINECAGYHEKIGNMIQSKMTSIPIGSEDQLKLLAMELFGCINASRDLSKGSSDQTIVILYDRLLAIRKSIIDACAKKNEVAASLLNEFSITGRWYQIFYRPLNTLPAAPWNEARDNENGNPNKVLEHCQAVRNGLNNNSLSDDVKNFYRLYLLTMRELIIVVANHLQRRFGGPVKTGAIAAVATTGILGLALKYFFGGKKPNQEINQEKYEQSIKEDESSENNEE